MTDNEKWAIIGRFIAHLSPEPHFMPRPFNDDLSTPWKINMPATLAGKIEFLLLDPIHQKPIYASRNKLIVALLKWWEARERGLPDDQLPNVPTILELRNRQ